MMAGKIHVFDNMSSSRVYDATQVRDNIKMGDILVIPDEQVVGFLCGAWPIAVTKKNGRLHARDPKCDWINCCNHWNQDDSKKGVDYHSSLTMAHTEAASRGWEIGNRTPTDIVEEDKEYGEDEY
jgi:hypothetical protein